MSNPKLTAFAARVGDRVDGLHVFGFLEKIQLDEDMTPRDPDRQALFDVASEQRGHFSTDQAAKAGYARDMLTYHVQRGTFQRVHCGVYRFRDYPSSPRDELVAAWLTVGSDVAVVSHESAPDQWASAMWSRPHPPHRSARPALARQ